MLRDAACSPRQGYRNEPCLPRLRADLGGPLSLLRDARIPWGNGFSGYSQTYDEEGKGPFRPMEKRTMSGYKLPTTDSIEELARFWDTHDLTDFEDQLEEVDAVVFERDPSTKMVLHLQPEELQAIREIAQARGLGQSELLREWVREKIGSRA